MTTTKQVARIGPFRDLVASGVGVGDILTLSGQVSVNGDGEGVGGGDIGLQLRRRRTAGIRAVWSREGHTWLGALSLSGRMPLPHQLVAQPGHRQDRGEHCHPQLSPVDCRGWRVARP